MQKSFKRVGTHDGRFHADEVMATAILKQIFEVEVIRTRDLNQLSKLDIVYDVGRGEFDHHSAEKEYRENGIPFAACGLIWRHFGREVISREDPSLMKEEIESVFEYVDRVLIEGIDAQDNGIKPEDEDIFYMNISTIISGFNPPWYSEQSEDESFHEAVEIGVPILENTIKRRIGVIKAREKVNLAYKKRKRSEVLVLDTYCPWQEALRDIDQQGQVLFVIYPNKENYAMQTVKDEDRETRKYLPEDWAGKENQDLSKITGVEDAVFCHTGRFIAVAGSLEGIQKMAEIAIQHEEDE